jgi:hypothetical protein
MLGWSQAPPPRPSVPEFAEVRVQQSYVTVPAYIHESPLNQPRPLEHQQLLLTLAEEYLAAAHAEGPAATTKKGTDQERYLKCIATGLACLQAVLTVSPCCYFGSRREGLIGRDRNGGFTHNSKLQCDYDMRVCFTKRPRTSKRRNRVSSKG